MSSILPARWLATLSALAALNAWAQPVPPPAQPALPYRSAFEGYRPFAEEKVASWKEANDTVGRIGGWRAYARQAQEPKAAAPHAGHGKP